MSMANPVGELDPEFSSQDAVPIPWAQALDALLKAEVYWLSTVRPDGRPHVTPLIAVWLQDAFYFCTGAGSVKLATWNIIASAVSPQAVIPWLTVWIWS